LLSCIRSPPTKQHVFEVYLGRTQAYQTQDLQGVSVLIERGQSKDFGDSVGLMGDFGHGVKLSRDGETVIDDANALARIVA
jgi:hypothetical protein